MKALKFIKNVLIGMSYFMMFVVALAVFMGVVMFIKEYLVGLHIDPRVAAVISFGGMISAVAGVIYAWAQIDEDKRG